MSDLITRREDVKKNWQLVRILHRNVTMQRYVTLLRII